MLRRIILGTSLTMLVLAGSIGPVAAHEGEHGGQPEPFAVTCGGVDYVVTSGNGNWSAAVTEDRRSHFIPKAFSFTVSDEDGNVLFSETVEKGNGNAHKNQETITCTFGGEEVDPEGNVFVFSGTATVVERP